jgi:hypothetical protein
MKVLVVNHHLTEHCGVYSMGKRIGDILTSYNPEKYSYAEANSADEMRDLMRRGWNVIIYNFHPSTMGWLPNRVDRSTGAKHLGLIHEVTQGVVNGPPEPWLDGWIVTDPSIALAASSQRWFRTVRPLPSPVLSRSPVAKASTKIGSFGFAFPNKGFERLTKAVFQEFEEVELRLHVTKAFFSGSGPLTNPEEIFSKCRQHVRSTKQLLTCTQHFMSDEELINWLAENDLNCLFYDPNQGRGLASTVDFCVSSGAPLLTTRSEQFRHINTLLPTFPDCSLKDAGRSCDVGGLQSAWDRSKYALEMDDVVARAVSL